MTAQSNQRSPWADAGLSPAGLAWVKDVDRIMKRDWYIDLEMAGASAGDVLRYWRFGDSPEDFVEWFAAKYDLIRFD